MNNNRLKYRILELLLLERQEKRVALRQAISEGLGIGRVQLSKKINARVGTKLDFSGDDLLFIAKVLNVGVAELFGRDI